MNIIQFLSKDEKGYTLLELMAVIGILAILATIAIPVYTSQINKSRIGSALNTLSGLEQAAKIAYEESPNNTNITYGGVTLTSNLVTELNAAPVVNVLYIAPEGSPGIAANQFLVCIYVGQLVFSGYVAPTASTTGSYTRVCKLTTDNETIYTSKCGALDGSNADVPTSYLPTTCNCANILSGAC